MSDGAVLSAALAYAGRGWCVIPIVSRGKIPTLKAWQHNASREPSTIEGWFSNGKADANLAVQLGPRSGIVDVETDGPEQAAALLDLFDGEPPVTANFRSARGRHWLFQWDDRMGSLGAVSYLNGVGFRLGAGTLGAFSVFPPSVHESGAVYRWEASPDDVGISSLPAELILRLGRDGDVDRPLLGGAAAGGSERDWPTILEGVAEGGRNEAAAALIGKLLHGLADPYETELVRPIWQVVLAWNAANRPPLDGGELRKTFESILRRERAQRTEADIVPTWTRQAAQDATPAAAEASGAAGGEEAPEAATGAARGKHEPPKGWSLVAVTSEPPIFQLFSPYWEGPINLGAKELNRPGLVKDAALAQRLAFVPKAVSKRWEELTKKLVLSVERREAPVELNRRLMIYSTLYETLTDLAKHLGEDQDQEVASRAASLQADGSIVFQFSQAMIWLALLQPPATHRELSACLEEVGCETVRLGAKKRRYKLLSREGFERLRQKAQL